MFQSIFCFSQAKNVCQDSACVVAKPANIVLVKKTFKCLPNNVCPFGRGLSFLNTVFPRINARGVYFKIRDFREAFIRGGRLFEAGRLFQNFKNSENRIWTDKNKKTLMPCDQCYSHCDMLTN